MFESFMWAMLKTFLLECLLWICCLVVCEDTRNPWISRRTLLFLSNGVLACLFCFSTSVRVQNVYRVVGSFD
jgi:hypothetical protein